MTVKSMAEIVEGTSEPYSEIMLNSYPSCEDCMRWSEDGLAVAIGGHISLIHRKHDAKSNRAEEWTSTNIRVDMFTQEEWPERSLRSIRTFSIGAEQSESTVIALSWSTCGIGIHRRYVLGVLTSNLLLSIWETNGFEQGWRRTGIVNNRLDAAGDDTVVHAKHVRAFCWITPAIAAGDSKAAGQNLLVVEDNGILSFLNIGKQDRTQFGGWQMSVICSTRLLNAQAVDGTEADTFITRLAYDAMITSLFVSEWQPTNEGNNYRLTIRYETISKHRTGTILLDTNADPMQSGGRFLELDHTSDDHGVPFQRAFKSDDHDGWDNILERVSHRFEKRHNINGARVRIWGSAKDEKHRFQALCVTTHPRDTVEYTSAVQEKCHVLIRMIETRNSLTSSYGEFRTAREVLVSILESVISDCPIASIVSDFDLRLYEVLLAAAKVAGLEQGSTDLKAMHLPQSEHDRNVGEVCSMCESAIAIENLQNGACASGHIFTRCNLTFLCIQQPGISKYCSGCERQFLCSLKLGPHAIESVIMNLLDRYDACPYCKGKFRG